MIQTRQYDAIVIGAGPAGSHAARLLAEEGHDVALVDRNEGPRSSIVCSGIIGSEAYRKLELTERDVVQSLRRARFFSPAGYEVPHETSQPFAYVVERTAFDGMLLDRARRAGVEYIPRCHARDLEYGRESVAIHLQNCDKSFRIKGKVALLATGHQRWIQRRAPVGAPSAYIHGIHADVSFREIDAAELYFGRDVAPGFFAWVVPFGRNRARVGILSHRRGERLFHRFLESEPVRNRLVRRNGEATPSFCSRGLVQGLVDPSYAERLMLIGEAAGHVKTTTGGGIHYGILGAEIASEIASRGFRGKGFSASALGLYQKRCQSIFGGEIRSGFRLQRLGRSMQDEQIDELFDALRNGLGTAVRKVVRFDWHRPALRALLAGWSARH
jgi:digeranylgeranylglycerophospholipid reductase